MVRGVVAASLIAILLAPPIASVAVAQDKKAPTEPAKAKQEAPKKAPGEPARGAGSATNGKPATEAAVPQKVPNGAALNILIRRTLLTVNDANLSGNYTVLRDLAAPDFQSANDAKKLADIFSKLRSSKIDLAPIVFFDPKLVRPPDFTPNGLLRLSGFVPTKPQQVNFEMLFQHVDGRWRLFGIAVNTSLAKAVTATPANDQAPPK